MFLSATTSANDPRLIFIDLTVEGASRRLRALVDSGASNNFIGIDCLEVLHPNTPVLELTDNITVRLADGRPRVMPKRVVKLDYGFNKFNSTDEFFIIDLSKSFDCILGMPWLQKYQPEIDWIGCSIKAKCLDVDEVCARLERAKNSWLAVSIVDSPRTSDTDFVCDGPLCAACGTTIRFAASSEAKLRKNIQKECITNMEAQSKTADIEYRSCSGMIEGRPSSRADTRGYRSHNGVIEDQSTQATDVCVSAPRSGVPKQDLMGVSAPRSGVPKQDLMGISAPRSGVPKQDLRVSAPRSGVPKQDLIGVSAPRSGVPKQDLSHLGEQDEELTVMTVIDNETCLQHVLVKKPPDIQRLLSLPEMTWKNFLSELKLGDIEQVCMITSLEEDEEVSAREKRFKEQSWDSLRESNNPVYGLVRQYADVFPDKIPSELPKDRGIRHEIDLTPGTKYCVTRQWPLPKEQVDAIDEFFEKRRDAGHVRESASPHSSPTFCVKKATGGWRIVHAFNKLNDATIPAQTPIPRKDMIIDSMAGSTIFSAIDLTDGFYQILMRESDVPLTAVSTPSGMLWEWLVMPQGLKNAPATFNRMVSNVLRPYRHFAPSYLTTSLFIVRPMKDDRRWKYISITCVKCLTSCVRTGCMRT